MTPQQYITWFRGFSEACHHLNPTPQQWAHILDTLKKVDDTHECHCGKKTYNYTYSAEGPVNVTGGKTQLND